MEPNLISAYKSLFLVKSDPNIGALAAAMGLQPEAVVASIDGMMGSIRGALVAVARAKADAAVDAELSKT